MVLKTRSRSIQLAIPGDNSSILEFYTPGSDTLGTEVIEYTGLIESLQLFVKIESIDAPPLPTFPEDASQAQIAQLYRQHQYSVQRYEASLYKKRGADGVWKKRCSVALQRQDPFYIIDFDVFLSKQVAARVAFGDYFGIKIDNVGYGLPDDLLDEITLFGDIEEEANLHVEGAEDFTLLNASIQQLAAKIEEVKTLSIENRASIEFLTNSTLMQSIRDTQAIQGAKIESIDAKTEEIKQNQILIGADIDSILPVIDQVDNMTIDVQQASTDIENLINGQQQIRQDIADIALQIEEIDTQQGNSDPFPGADTNAGSAVVSAGKAVVSDGKAVVVNSN